MKQEKHTRVVVSNYDCRLKHNSTQPPQQLPVPWTPLGIGSCGPLAASLPDRPGSPRYGPSFHLAFLLTSARRGGLAFTCKSTFPNCPQSPVRRRRGHQNCSPNKLNEGGAVMTAGLTVTDAFVPQIKNIAEVRRPHFA